MLELHNLKDTFRVRKRVQRVGRGIGSKRGKTSCRGQKGFGSRSGYTTYYGREGGQMPLYRKLPKRGFTNARFAAQPKFVMNLDEIHELFQDGDVVSEVVLRQQGIIRGQKTAGLKILGNGICTRKVTIEAEAISEAAAEKLGQAGIAFTIVQ